MKLQWELVMFPRLNLGLLALTSNVQTSNFIEWENFQKWM
jgi:hypothetical protein